MPKRWIAGKLRLPSVTESPSPPNRQFLRNTRQDLVILWISPQDQVVVSDVGIRYLSVIFHLCVAAELPALFVNGAFFFDSVEMGVPPAKLNEKVAAIGRIGTGRHGEVEGTVDLLTP